MKKTYILIALVLTAAMWLTPASAITFGEPDEGRHPNVGAVMIGFGFPVCSGTLIHPRIFLTAGHCTVFFERLLSEGGIDEVRVSFDEAPDERNFGKFAKVEQVITHPDFAGPGDSFFADARDIGLLVLKRPLKNPAPARLPELGFLNLLQAAGLLSGAQFTVVGYGGSLRWPPPQIFFGDRRQVAQSEFRGLRNPWLQMSQVPAPGTADGGTCFGDSGGPTFWTESDGTEILVAVTSWGDVNCVATGIAYRTDISQTVRFIDDVIASLE